MISFSECMRSLFWDHGFVPSAFFSGCVFWVRTETDGQIEIEPKAGTWRRGILGGRTHTHAPMQALIWDACKCNRILRLCTF